eukprot:CAMPEP_0181457320 /NCGR_PEP_ID=MMETSP1110-20121109/31727_1 /TAXON_ID=174948 /ORGANISM="Symbiodinium sp., Strain CCMP421" /LENGTH=145 /DNA_ID=CAMNT_0023581761 /DNA_START=60 /DNA_END=497 /DNA_ORIENTATION=+
MQGKTSELKIVSPMPYGCASRFRNRTAKADSSAPPRLRASAPPHLRQSLETPLKQEQPRSDAGGCAGCAEGAASLEHSTGLASNSTTLANSFSPSLGLMQVAQSFFTSSASSACRAGCNFTSFSSSSSKSNMPHAAATEEMLATI